MVHQSALHVISSAITLHWPDLHLCYEQLDSSKLTFSAAQPTPAMRLHVGGTAPVSGTRQQATGCNTR